MYKTAMLLCCLIALPCAEQASFDAFTIVEAIHRSDVSAEGATRNVIHRYVLKDATVVALGERLFLYGKTPSERNIAVAGSKWASLYIPIDSIVAMAGVASHHPLVAREGVINADLGVPVGR